MAKGIRYFCKINNKLNVTLYCQILEDFLGILKYYNLDFNNIIF